MKFLQRLFFPSNQDLEIKILQHRLAACEEQIEKTLELVNNLATFDVRFSRDLHHLASCVSSIELAIVRMKSQSQVSNRRTSNDDDMIN